ncbi:glycosyltransferase family 2 protein [Candidatus Berkelbacteria bacterium]|nr:glycosyltransferase family 2 protein [Candidatus Berkelbacteria bacterium]
MKLLIFSICKNEETTIAELIKRIPKKIDGIKELKVVIIDDGSTDKTVEIAKKAGATVFYDGVQKRLASRFRQALEIAIKEKADIMVNIDGDLQFNPEDIPNFVAPIVKNEADFVAADRFTGIDGKKRKPNNMPSVKYYGNMIGAFIVSSLTGQKFNDVTCGFRAYNREAIVKLNINGDFTYTQESFQVLALKKVRIKTIPTYVKYFKDRKSRVVSSIPKFIWSSALNIIRSYRDFAPLRFFGLLGLLPFILGFASSMFVLIHWLNTGSFSPYKFLGFVGVYLLSIGLLIWFLGLVADMLSRMLNNQEKIIELIKKSDINSD